MKNLRALIPWGGGVGVVLVYLNKYNCPHASAAQVNHVIFLKIYGQESTQPILPRICTIYCGGGGHIALKSRGIVHQ